MFAIFKHAMAFFKRGNDSTQSENQTRGAESAPIPEVEKEEDVEPYGLKVLATGGPNAIFDIVAVHGLGGHREQSWMHQATGKNWLKHFLPLEFPECRIMTFGYDASPTKFWKSTCNSFVYEHGQTLLSNLASIRDGCEERPLMFVGHSMGGIVIKHALIDSHLQKDWDWPRQCIKRSTFAVATFATPHAGADGAKTQARLLDLVRRFSPLSVNSATTAHLAAGSQNLRYLHDQYLRINEDFRNVFFYESRKTRVGLCRIMIVDRSSAAPSIPQSVNLSLNKDHISIIKFGSRMDSDYCTVRDEIRRSLRFHFRQTSNSDLCTVVNESRSS